MPNLADRRNSQRFSLQLALRCQCVEDGSDRTIFGEAVNISSTGLLFMTTEDFVPGQTVTAFINWPAYLDNRVQLQLVVEGPVVRRAVDCVAIRIERHEFRTRRTATGDSRRSDISRVLPMETRRNEIRHPH